MIRVRPATVEDIPRISELNQQIYRFEEQFGNTNDPAWTYSPVGQKYFQERVKGKNSIVLIAEDGKDVVGYLLCAWDEWPHRRTPVIAELESMCVDEPCRRLGIGTMLVQEMLARLQGKHITQIRIETIAGNEVALAFYRKQGFADHSRILEKTV